MEETLVFYVKFPNAISIGDDGRLKKVVSGPFPTVDMLLAHNDDVSLSKEQKIEVTEGKTVYDYVDVEKTILYAIVYSEVERCKR